MTFSTIGLMTDISVTTKAVVRVQPEGRLLEIDSLAQVRQPRVIIAALTRRPMERDTGP